MRSISIVAPRVISLLSRVTPIRIQTLVLFPFVLTQEPLDSDTKAHADVHLAQQLELSLFCMFAGLTLMWFTGAQLLGYLLWIALCWLPFIGPFYLLYVAMYLGILFSLFYKGVAQSNHWAAYYKVPFEREAHDYENKRRKIFGWLRYILK